MADKILNWKHFGYDMYNIYVHDTPPDGHCMIHSILFLLSSHYNKGIFKNKKCSKEQFAIIFRKGVADKLLNINDNTGKTTYDEIGNGILREYSANNSSGNDHSLFGLRRLLISNRFLGYETLIVLEHILDINIYVLDGLSKDAYYREHENKKKSIVIYYANNHFESVFLIDCDGNKQSFFSHDHPFILHIRKRILSLVQKFKMSE